MAAAPSGYKPSPLGYGSPRSSPFRRPESPASSPTGNRGSGGYFQQQTTPTTSPTKTGSFVASRVAALPTTPTNNTSPWLGTTASQASTAHQRQPSHDDDVFARRGSAMRSPRLGSPAAVSPRAPPSPQPTATLSGGNALSKLQPAQVRTLRDSFQILDRDSDGSVNREDVADMMAQLGLPSAPSDLSPFFPAGQAQTLTLAAYLNSLASSLAELSDGAELLSAFSAFDDDDSGQIDVAELKKALLETPPEQPGQRTPTAAEVDRILAGFTGRRAFSKSAVSSSAAGGGPRRGEVFKYQEFVNSVSGTGANNSEPNSQGNSEG